MQIRWSPAAAEDLEQLFNYIRTDNPGASERVAQIIYDRAGALGTDPYLGRRGFIVVYRILEHMDAVEIVNVIHGAQRWPPAK
jgi:toxin ParE1/3/4